MNKDLLDEISQVKEPNMDDHDESLDDIWEAEPDDDCMTLDEFIECCEDGGFIDYDGVGYYSNSTEEYKNSDETRVYPSDITSGKINRNYKYVFWFNR